MLQSIKVLGKLILIPLVVTGVDDMEKTRYPLAWPVGWPRTRQPESSRFDPRGDRSFATARDALIAELERLGAASIILSTNIPLRKDGLPRASSRQPEDRGVAVYFRVTYSLR